jgi:small subunit ribosomal protein S9e
MNMLAVYGLRNKFEIYRITQCLGKVRNSARVLLQLPLHNSQRVLQGGALIRRLQRYGLIRYDRNRLEDVLDLNVQTFLECRLQSLVFRVGLARSVHHARVLIRGGGIVVDGRSVTIPSFLVSDQSRRALDVCQCIVTSNATFKSGKGH